MSLFITITFDLLDAKASQYTCIEEVLKKYKLKGTLSGEPVRDTKLPDNVYAGEVIGKDAVTVSDLIAKELEGAFKKCEIKGKYFITVGSNWAWVIGDV